MAPPSFDPDFTCSEYIRRWPWPRFCPRPLPESRSPHPLPHRRRQTHRDGRSVPLPHRLRYSLLIRVQSLRSGFNQRIGRRADGHDHAVHIQHKLRTRLLDRPASSGGIRLAQLHLDTLHAASQSPSHRPEPLPDCTAVLKMIPSSSACSTSSLRAGSSSMPRRYTIYTSFAPRRLAHRAASIATLPPPTTAPLLAFLIGVEGSLSISLH